MTNWRTTLAGLALAVWVAVQPMITDGGFDWHKDWKNLVGAVIVAALAFLMKDAKVTGVGPTAMTEKEVEKRVEDNGSTTN